MQLTLQELREEKLVLESSLHFGNTTGEHRKKLLSKLHEIEAEISYRTPKIHKGKV